MPARRRRRLVRVRAEHLAVDYIAVSGSLQNRVLEYVDHLHEHFLEPVVIRNGRYMPPQRPGYSIEMTAETLERYQYPNGPVWIDLAQS